MGKQKKLFFTILIVLLPLVLFMLFEGLLCLLDAYPQPPLFLEKSSANGHYLQVNTDVGERYFDKRIMPVPTLLPQKFLAEKSDNTIRIFCLGSSTTAGFPYEKTVPFPRQLEFMLTEAYPDQSFEVINLGLSTINSFTVLDWIPEILDQDPDLILLYVGHNEFYGAYGTGSTISLGQKEGFIRLALKLQKYRVVQMISSIIDDMSPPPATTPSLTRMEKIVADPFIEATSVLSVVTHASFANNLDLILQACQSSGVPVVLSNLVSNLKDQIPLDMTSKEQGKPTPALKLFKKGKKEFSQGDTATALISFSRANNLDATPLRASGIINRIIMDKAKKFAQPGVDMVSAFNRASEAGIPGQDLFCDHLHPNPKGYTLMASSFMRGISKTGILPARVNEPLDIDPLFVTDLDWEIGSLKNFQRLNRWPFGDSETGYKHYPPRIDSATTKIAKTYLFGHSIWSRAHSEMADHFIKTGDLMAACMEYQAMISIYPDRTAYYAHLVSCAIKTNQWELVKSTCLTALPLAQDKGMFNYHLALAYQVDGDLELALSYVQKAIEAPELTKYESATVNFTYANLLLDIKKPMDAKLILEKLIKNAPDFTQARDLLIKLNNVLGYSSSAAPLDPTFHLNAGSP